MKLKYLAFLTISITAISAHATSLSSFDNAVTANAKAQSALSDAKQKSVDAALSGVNQAQASYGLHKAKDDANLASSLVNGSTLRGQIDAQQAAQIAHDAGIPSPKTNDQIRSSIQASAKPYATPTAQAPVTHAAPKLDPKNVRTRTQPTPHQISQSMPAAPAAKVPAAPSMKTQVAQMTPTAPAAKPVQAPSMKTQVAQKTLAAPSIHVTVLSMKPSAPAAVSVSHVQSTPPTPAAKPAQTPSITGTSYRQSVAAAQAASLANPAPANPTTKPAPDKPAPTAATTTVADAPGTINQQVTNINPNTKVNVTVNGVTTQTTAGALAKVNPQMQVAVPHKPAIIGSPVKSGGNHDKSSSHNEHGTGNGGSNAANSRSANGLGGGNHIGGGSAQSGSRNVGHW
ncbi:hypothetical protein [Lelliottia sp. WAP21]|uniref:hypothetical protein n=1 Tax=Lelliottia sp. WAP21 TaxID=2877426 RepID=UPI001E5D29DB|nr:hypothetical protein [Lelliottia sp. WAP21]